MAFMSLDFREGLHGRAPTMSRQVQHAAIADVDSHVRAVRLGPGVEEQEVERLERGGDARFPSIVPKIAGAKGRQHDSVMGEERIGEALAVRSVTEEFDARAVGDAGRDVTHGHELVWDVEHGLVLIHHPFAGSHSIDSPKQSRLPSGSVRSKSFIPYGWTVGTRLVATLREMNSA